MELGNVYLGNTILIFKKITECVRTGNISLVLDEGVLIDVYRKRRLPVQFYYNSY